MEYAYVIEYYGGIEKYMMVLLVPLYTLNHKYHGYGYAKIK